MSDQPNEGAPPTPTSATGDPVSPAVQPPAGSASTDPPARPETTAPQEIPAPAPLDADPQAGGSVEPPATNPTADIPTADPTPSPWANPGPRDAAADTPREAPGPDTLLPDAGTASLPNNGTTAPPSEWAAPVAGNAADGTPGQPPVLDTTLPTAGTTDIPTDIPTADATPSPWAAPAPGDTADGTRNEAPVFDAVLPDAGTASLPNNGTTAPPSEWATPVPGSAADWAAPPPGADHSGPIPVVIIPDGPPPPTQVYPSVWDAGGPAEPRPRKSRRKMWLSLLAAGVVAVLLVVGYTAVRFLMDLSAYHDGHAAYERADCAGAVTEFDPVINGWRLVTLGDTVRRAESEKAECLVFRQAADRQQAGDKPGALAAYARFVPDRPASPLTDAARKRVGELFGGPDLAALATMESCGALEVMRTEKLLVPDSAPGFYAACGAAFATAHETGKALAVYGRLFTDYGDHKVAAETEAKISTDTAWCLELDRVRADPVLSVRGDLLPGLLATCSTASIVPDSVAMTNAEEFLKKYPGHPRTAEVLGALARLINKAAREAAGANDIGQADLVGSVGGNQAVIMVYNDSNEPLRVAFSGPQPRVETIDPCPSCTIKSGNDNICRKEAVGKRIVVAPGEYDLAFGATGESSTPTKDAFAHWSLQPGKEYFSCLVSYREG